MTEADQIREYAFHTFVRPAREQGHSSLAIAARDVHDALGLTSHFPNVCQVLRGEKFRDMHGVELIGTIGPDPSSTTIFVFQV